MKTLEGPSRILRDDEIVTTDNFCGSTFNEDNGLRSQATPVSNEACIGQTARECRIKFKGYEFYASGREPVFDFKFNFVGNLEKIFEVEITAVEALIYCLGFISDTPEDGEYTSQRAYDKNGNPHWVAWKVNKKDQAIPLLCSENPDGSFIKALEPYRFSK